MLYFKYKLIFKNKINKKEKQNSQAHIPTKTHKQTLLSFPHHIGLLLLKGFKFTWTCFTRGLHVFTSSRKAPDHYPLTSLNEIGGLIGAVDCIKRSAAEKNRGVHVGQLERKKREKRKASRGTTSAEKNKMRVFWTFPLSFNRKIDNWTNFLIFNRWKVKLFLLIDKRKHWNKLCR